MAISFAGGVKTEICRAFPQKNCCAVAECFGILLFCNHFAHDNIRIITESREFGQTLPYLFRKAFNVEFDIFPSMEAPGKLIFQIVDPDKIEHIMASYGFSRDNTVSLHLNLPVVEDECCRTAFLRGAFLAGGSVTDPEKGYHLELTTTHKYVVRETYALMEEVLGFYPKMTARGGVFFRDFGKNTNKGL